MADIHKFAKHINGLSDSNQLSMENEFKNAIPDFNKDDNLGYACTDLFLQILDEIYDGTSVPCKKPSAPADNSSHAQVRNNFSFPFPDVAPELTGDPLFIVTGAELGITRSDDDFSEYLENTQEKYQTIKTLLYSEVPRPFYDFYVCNTLTYKVSKGRNS